MYHQFLITLLLFIHLEGTLSTTFGCSNPGSTDELRKLYLDKHNTLRNSVAQGKQGFSPNKAKNMYKLEWNCELEDMAQRHIESCDGGWENHQSYGQNSKGFIALNLDGRYEEFIPTEEITEALESWWSAVDSYGVDEDKTFTDMGYYSFANMVYSKSTQIGCAHKDCGTAFQVYCLYDRIGAFFDRPMWRTGQPCRSDSECTVFPGSRCESGLCVKPKEEPDKGENTRCKNSEGMTDAVRKKFLDMHNFYRSQVALGRAADRLARGGKAPKASKMQKLKYSCRLEKSAMDYAKHCVFTPSYLPNIGENLYKFSIPNFDKLTLASLATEEWFEELEDSGVGDQNIFTSQLYSNAMIYHYTQMVWQNTKQLGCGVHHCHDMSFVVCHYSNPGNKFDQRIYAKGEPCSRCDSAESCNPDEGLCYKAV